VTINITGLDGIPLQIGAPSATEPLTLEMESVAIPQGDSNG